MSEKWNTFMTFFPIKMLRWPFRFVSYSLFSILCFRTLIRYAFTCSFFSPFIYADLVSLNDRKLNQKFLHGVDRTRSQRRNTHTQRRLTIAGGLVIVNVCVCVISRGLCNTFDDTLNSITTESWRPNTNESNPNANGKIYSGKIPTFKRFNRPCSIIKRRHLHSNGNAFRKLCNRRYSLTMANSLTSYPAKWVRKNACTIFGLVWLESRLNGCAVARFSGNKFCIGWQ